MPWFWARLLWTPVTVSAPVLLTEAIVLVTGLRDRLDLTRYAIRARLIEP